MADNEETSDNKPKSQYKIAKLGESVEFNATSAGIEPPTPSPKKVTEKK